LAFVLVLAHALVDALGRDYRPPYGVPLAWPLDGRYLIAEWAFFLDVRRGPLGWDVMWHNLKAMGLELAVLGPPAALVLWLRTRRQPAPAR
jgi:inner membrane protein